jgi:hypothetical protein
MWLLNGRKEERKKEKNEKVVIINSIFSCTQNTKFVFEKFFPPKIMPFMSLCGKIWWSQTGACALHVG